MALSHPSEWGVRPAETDLAGQVIWVWIELAFGFLHGIEPLGRATGRGLAGQTRRRTDWKIVHFLGYDNTFYHSDPRARRCTSSPSPEWTPDIDYHVNEFYLLDGDKFSTSRRHAIWGKDILGPGHRGRASGSTWR